MDNKNKNTIALILLFVLALIIGLAGIIFVIITIIDKNNITNENPTTVQQQDKEIIEPTAIIELEETNEGTLVTAMDPPPRTVVNQQIDYNFSISLENTGIKDDLIPIALIEELSQQSIANSESVTRIKISALGVDAPVVHGVDGDIAIDLGWWMYPASKENGEKIILAHRRYWQVGHPYSAWNIDTLPIGTIITLYDNTGKSFKYTISSQSIVESTSDLSVYRPSNSDYLKIITCSTFSGNAGSSSHRYVTLAKPTE